jgi:hypothetical protein
MPSYPVLCYTRGCGRPAEYKIAAAWSDGVTGELKCYGLACAGCVGSWFRRARESQRRCRLVAGETLQPPGVYRLNRASRDRELQRLPEVEERLLAEAT